MVMKSTLPRQERTWAYREQFQQMLRREGLRQSDVAIYLGVSDPAITNWMRQGFPVDHCLRLEVWLGIKAWKFATDPDVVRLLKLFGVRSSADRGFAGENGDVA